MNELTFTAYEKSQAVLSNPPEPWVTEIMLLNAAGIFTALFILYIAIDYIIYCLEE